MIWQGKAYAFFSLSYRHDHTDGDLWDRVLRDSDESRRV